MEGRIDGLGGGRIDVPELLVAVCGTGATGRLDLRSHGGEKRILLKGGRIVFASSSSPDDRLGVYLLSRGELSLRDLRRMTRLMHPGVRLGTLLVEHGLLAPERLPAAVLGQVEAIIMGLFRWVQLEYRFHEAPLAKEAITLRVPTERLILEGVRTVENWRRILRGVGSLDASWVCAERGSGAARGAHLDPVAREVLERLEEPRSVEGLCDAVEAKDLEVCQLLWAFAALGWIRPVGASEPPSDESEAQIDADLEGLGMILGRQWS